MSMQSTYLVADIGGTNARFALIDPYQSSPVLTALKVFHCSDFASLQHATEHYIELVSAKPTKAAIAVASPVTGDEIRLTNRAWSFSQKELKEHFHFDELHVLNDFGAVAHSIPALNQEDTVTLHGTYSALSNGPVSILGPGTGLGVALLVGDSKQGWNAVATEGGHVSFAPLNDEEYLISRWLTARFGRASTERLLCGSGLSHIYAALDDKDFSVALNPSATFLNPADIVQAALDGHDLKSRRALARFCSVLGSVAGDIALMHGARKVFIAGGMVPRFIPFLRSSSFREKFLSKGRMTIFVESVPIQVITHPMPGLLGAARFLKSTDNYTAT